VARTISPKMNLGALPSVLRRGLDFAFFSPLVPHPQEEAPILSELYPFVFLSLCKIFRTNDVTSAKY